MSAWKALNWLKILKKKQKNLNMGNHLIILKNDKTYTKAK